LGKITLEIVTSGNPEIAYKIWMKCSLIGKCKYALKKASASVIFVIA
jgi:hypothetical protein